MLVFVATNLGRRTPVLLCYGEHLEGGEHG
jgi:hypothetical protein